MKHEIPVSVRQYIAALEADVLYVCDNSEYVIVFDFDSDWDEHETKTARFNWCGGHHDEIFSGNVCKVPKIQDAPFFEVGVYAGNLETSSPARVKCKKSILSRSGLPHDPTPDVYAQLMALLNTMSEEEIAKVVESTLTQAKESGEFDGPEGPEGKAGYTPVKGVDYFDGKDGKDGDPGAPGTSVTVSSVSESSADGGSNVVTFSDGKTVTIKNGKTGADGKDGQDGHTPVKGVDYFDGKDGKDGDPGAPGTSVTVSSVSESSADGGSNVVTFSDGKTVTIKNGKTGADGKDGYTPVKGVDYFDGKDGQDGKTGPTGPAGKTPVKGTDYWTAADQESIIQQAIAALGTPVFGRVDAQNNIILSGSLTDGFYTIKYEEADGNLIEIGSLGLPSGPSYTNLLPAAIGYDGNVLGGVGYVDGYRLTGDAGVSGQLSYHSPLTGYFMTGYMPITKAQIENGCSIYVKGVSVTAEDGNVRALIAPDYNYTGYINNVKIANSGISGVKMTKVADQYYRFDLSYDFLRNGNYPASSNPAFTDIKYFKLSFAGSGSGVIITLNEPIE